VYPDSLIIYSLSISGAGILSNEFAVHINSTFDRSNGTSK